MFAHADEVERKPAAGPCARIVAAVFGTMFLVALLAVPVTTSTSRVRRDPSSNIVTRTTYPRKATMFLPQVLSMRARPRPERTVELRAVQWTATMGIIAVLGLFDYFVFCRVLRRARRPEEDRS
ncbi:MAG: hypothetical protein HGA94_04915 [Candidatus Aminicenantes bacterium]|nr:hypothetical protein [Candidatus Aminicenantes bacterium]NTV80638.1 hypothetical protein [Candidatus Aminicenantes bacterium]